MKKIAYISGTRADFGLLEKTLKELRKKFDLTIIATGMHLSEKHGYTVRDIAEMGFKIKKVDMLLDSNSLIGMAKSFGIGTYGIAQALEEIEPDLVFVEGDRGEALAGAISGSHLGVPVVHQGGGDVSDSIDNKIRYAISTFADYHFVGNPQSYQNLIKIGFNANKVFMVGEPGLDEIYDGEFTPKSEVLEKFAINPEKKLLLLIFHPNTNEFQEVKTQILELLKAVSITIQEMNVQVIALTANSDAGGLIINQELMKYKGTHPIETFQLFENFKRQDFLGLLNACDAMVGNSSSGLTELPSFKKPFICVGTRQRGRLRAENVLEVGYTSADITKALQKAIFNENFKQKLSSIKNPYGEGKVYAKITKIICDILKERC